MVGSAFKQCTACSAAVVQQYRQRGWEFILEALQVRERPLGQPLLLLWEYRSRGRCVQQRATLLNWRPSVQLLLASSLAGHAAWHAVDTVSAVEQLSLERWPCSPWSEGQWQVMLCCWCRILTRLKT